MIDILTLVILIFIAVKSKTIGGLTSGTGNVIRRTASLDTIYLKGQWPRDSFYLHASILQVDKATQVGFFSV